MKHLLTALSLLSVFPAATQAQVIFSAATNSGVNLFQENGGVVTQLNTGFNEHNFPSISPDSRFITFSSPDPVTPALQVPPSSDIYAYDRVTGQTRKIIDTNTEVVSPSEVQVYRPFSSALSPNNQLLASGIELSRRSGNTPNGSGRYLTIVSAANGVPISTPRGAESDSTNGEFLGISWDRGGTSLVTPALGVTSPPSGFGLPAIWRVSQDASGQFAFTAQLSAPVYNSAAGSATTQIYPAISPSGTALAYFDVFFPDLFTSSQPVTSRLIVANSNGSNADIVVTFRSGLYPVGLAWSRDGTQLVFSTAEQIQFPGGSFSTLVDPSTAVIRQVSFAGGTPTRVPGIGTGLFPSVPVAALLPSINNDRTAPTLRLRGRKTVETLRKRVVIRGSASDAFGISKIDVKARGAKVRKTKIQSRNRFKVVLRVNKDRGRVIVKLRAIDNAGNRSKREKFRILRR